MLEPAVLGATFVAVLLAEIGDKTQIMTLALAAKNRAILPVFVGSVLGEVSANSIGVAIGTFLGIAIPVNIVSLIAGAVFIIFGILNIVKKEEEHGEVPKAKTKSILLSAFYLIFLAEMGDKTQILTLGLSAQYQNPITVLIGLSLAFMTISSVGALLGERASKILPMKWIKIASGVLFIIFGILFIVGINLL
ncbi:MAG: TMEM165/GDT1 family protein [Thaumarchaeota archaeon]|nr:TMEM165/GDT1 family protein [Nitrososphaerota archaeon]